MFRNEKVVETKGKESEEEEVSLKGETANSKNFRPHIPWMLIGKYEFILFYRHIFTKASII